VQHIGERFQFSLGLDLSELQPRYNAAIFGFKGSGFEEG
jgi:hypothetical protein